MWTKSVLCAAVAAVIGSLWSADIPAYDATYTKEGVTYAQRGGLGVKDFVVTNIIVNGQPKPLPPYLYQLDLDDTYPEDAKWYYQHADYSGGRCSARRVGNRVERNYDWHFDSAATFVLKVSGSEGRFASVGVANVGTNLTDGLVRSGAHSRYYKCLAGHTTDGVNENGVCVEVNVTSGTWPRTSGTVHGLEAVRWVLDHGTNAQQAAEYIAANVYLPQGFGENFHWMVADRDSTYIVENGAAHAVTNTPVVMTNFNLDRQGGEGYERYASLTNGQTIQSQWWTKAYDPATRPVRTSDLGGEAQQIWAAWNDGRTKEQHRGESFGGRFWWQTVHCSIYDLQNLTLRIAVQEIEDWYMFACPSVGKVKSVNGRVGDVSLDAAAVNALPDDEDELVNNENFKEAVATVSPPVELPAKWALANVTNNQGQAVGAADVHALADTTTHLSGDVPTTRKINNKELSADITLNYQDVGARPSNWLPNIGEIGGVATQNGWSYQQEIRNATIWGQMVFGNPSSQYSSWVDIKGMPFYFDTWDNLRKGSYQNSQSISNYIYEIAGKPLKIWTEDGHTYQDAQGGVYSYEQTSYWVPLSGPGGEHKNLVQVGPNEWETVKPYQDIYVKYRLVLDGETWKLYMGDATIPDDPWDFYDNFEYEPASGPAKDATRLKEPYGGFRIFERHTDEPRWQKVAQVAYSNDLANLVPRTFTINGTPMTGDGITIQGMTDNALVLNNGAVKTYAGAMVNASAIGAIDHQDATNVVTHIRDRFYDEELDVTWKRTVSGGRIFYDIEAVGNSTED